MGIDIIQISVFSQINVTINLLESRHLPPIHTSKEVLLIFQKKEEEEEEEGEKQPTSKQEILE